MTAPSTALRMDLEFLLPGDPRTIWKAIASANGISSWMLPTDLVERAGGTVRFHMGESYASTGEITIWEPRERLGYVEPGWAAMVGQSTESVTPLQTVFTIDPQPGDTCRLRVHTSSLGAGEEWEAQFFADMKKHWTPAFDNLRLYLSHFRGATVTRLDVEVTGTGSVDEVWERLCARLSSPEVGSHTRIGQVAGKLERLNSSPGPCELLIRTRKPVPAMFNLYVHGGMSEGEVAVGVYGYLFAEETDEARGYAAAHRAGWQELLESVLG